MNLVKTTTKIYSQGFILNLLCIFLNLIQIYMNFGIWRFSGIKTKLENR
jgi:hypothetical protein